MERAINLKHEYHMCEFLFLMWKPGLQQQKQLASLDLGFQVHLLISPFIPSTAVPFIKELFFWCRSTLVHCCISLFISGINGPHSLPPLFWHVHWPPCTDQWIHEVPKGYFLLFWHSYLSISLSPSLYTLVGSPNKRSCLLLVQHLILNMVFPLVLFVEPYWPYSGSTSKYLLVVWFHFMDFYFRKINVPLVNCIL